VVFVAGPGHVGVAVFPAFNDAWLVTAGTDRIGHQPRRPNTVSDTVSSPDNTTDTLDRL